MNLLLRQSIWGIMHHAGADMDRGDWDETEALDLFRLILELAPVVAAEVIGRWSDELRDANPTDGFPGVTKTPGLCGGRACIAGHRMPCHGLDWYRRHGYDTAGLLELHPHLTAEKLEAARDYAETHPLEMLVHQLANEIF